MTNTFKQLREKITPEQIRQLKKFYEPLRKVDMSKHKGQIDKTTAQLRKLNPMSLLQLSKQDIPIVSDVAKSILGKMNPKMSTEDWKDELKNQGNVRVGKTDSKGNWHSVSTSDKKEIEKLKSKGYEVVKESAISKQFRKNEDENRHTENYLLLAKEFGSSSDVKSVEAIIKRNKSRGYTSVEDNKWMHDNLSKHFRKIGESVEESLIVGLNKSSAEYRAGKEAAKKGIKYDANPHAPGVKRLNWSTGHNDFRADKLRKAGKPNYGARGQFEGLEEGTWHIAKDITKLKNTMKQPMPYNKRGFDFVAKYIGDDELWDDLGALKNGQDMVPAIKNAMKRLNIKEADLSKTQIKMVHDKADELPKQDFIKRYGKDGDAVRYATATNIVKKKLGIGEEFNEDTSPEVANVLKKYVIGHPLRFHGGPGLQGGKNKRDFIELQKLALSNMDKFRKKYNDMKAKSGEDNYNQQAVRDALTKAGLSKHLTNENKIEGEETMNESYKDKFNAQMKKAGIDSLGDLKTDAEKKAFFKAVDKSHTADHEEVKESLTKIDDFEYALRVHMVHNLGLSADAAAKKIDKYKKEIDKSMGVVHNAGMLLRKEEVTEDRGFSSAQIKQAYGVLNDPRYKQGNYSGAVAAIEKIAKGLSDHPDVTNALKRANESFSEEHDCENEHPGKSHDAWIKSKEKNEMKYDLEPNAKEINAMVKDPHKSKEGNPKDDLLAQWSDASVKADVKKKGGADMSKVKDAPKPEEALKKVTASYESKKYHDIKPGSLQDAVMQMQVNEQKSVTIRVKEFSAMVETYLARGGVSHNLSPVIAEAELSKVLPLQAVREFISTYNRHFLTNYRAEEFIIRDRLNEKLKAGRGEMTSKNRLDVVDFDWGGAGGNAGVSAINKKYKIKINPTRHGAEIRGPKANILKFLQSDDYGMDDRDIKKFWPELLESHFTVNEKQTQEGGPGSGPQANGVSKAKKQQSKAFDAATDKVRAKYGIGYGFKGKTLGDLSKAQYKQFFKDIDKAVAKI